MGQAAPRTRGVGGAGAGPVCGRAGAGAARSLGAGPKPGRVCVLPDPRPVLRPGSLGQVGSPAMPLSLGRETNQEPAATRGICGEGKALLLHQDQSCPRPCSSSTPERSQASWGGGLGVHSWPGLGPHPAPGDFHPPPPTGSHLGKAWHLVRHFHTGDGILGLHTELQAQPFLFLFLFFDPGSHQSCPGCIPT